VTTSEFGGGLVADANTAAGSGGAIAVDGASVDITRSTFSGNRAIGVTGSGGAIGLNGISSGTIGN
jgi:hypothetical protein